MLTEFANLSPEETAKMLDAIPYITILIGAADDNLDEVELQAAQRLADIRSFTNTGKLTAYYETIDGNLSNRIGELYGALPKNAEERQAVIVEKLTGLNDILSKLDSPFDYYYYHSFRTFATHVAKAHGGFLRFITIGPQEAKVVDLPMLNEIAEPEVDDNIL
ncbi:MAG: hypothetical protein AAF828_10060 [Bacteroidota bacterium]